MLDRETRQQLLTILGALPEFDTGDRRSLLLQFLPRPLVNQIPRDRVPAIDLSSMVAGCEAWEPLPKQDHPLGLLIATAREYAKGPQRLQIDALIAALPPGLVPATPRPPCPYPGMVPFRAEDARFFYGRESEIERMVLHLRQQQFLLVVGPSGSGKSSLIFAGLLPRLVASPYWSPGSWFVITLRPGLKPTAGLAEQLGGDSSTVAQAVTAYLAAHPPARRLLLVVDQFEEVFTQASPAEQHRFIAHLKALCALDTCAVVLAMRADFYPDLMTSDLWPVGAGQRLEVAPLRGEALRQAIVRPAADAGVIIEDGLVARLAGDAAGEPGSLPLLQETLALLWGTMAARTLTLGAYEALGSAERTGLAVAVAAAADATLAMLTAAQQALARRIFLRLIQFGEGRPDTRRQQPIAALRAAEEDPAPFQATLAVLTDQRLLTLTGAASQDKLVDLAHEAIITGWPTLQAWIDERREAEQTRRRLENKAAEWVRLGRGSGGLLDAAELPEAERWLQSTDAAELGASTDLLALVQASTCAMTAARRAQEAGCRRELRRIQGFAVFLAAAFVITAFLGLLVYLANIETQRQVRVVRAQALTANALAQLSRDPQLSALLAVEAAATTHRLGEPVAPQVEATLHQVLYAWPLLRTLRGHTDRVDRVNWSPDGHFLATASADGTARVWDVMTGEEVRRFTGHTDRVLCIAWRPDGQSIVTGSRDRTARIWDVATGRQQAILRGHGGGVTAAQWSPDGRSIVTADDTGLVLVWDVASGQERAALRGHSGYVISAMWSPDGGRLVTASEDNTARIWDVATGQSQFTLSGHSNWVHAAVWSPDGQSIVTTAGDGLARVWDARTGQVRATFTGHNGSQVNSAAWSPDGHTIVTAATDGTARIWDAATGQAHVVLDGHTDVLVDALWSPDGQLIVTASFDGTARVWDAFSGQTRAILAGHTGWINSVAWSPDGRSIATAGDDKTTRLWDAASGQEYPTLQGHTGAVTDAEWSPDGQRIVTASADKTARIWDAATGQVWITLAGHTDIVASAAWSPNGHAILTMSSDNTARVWDAITGQARGTLLGDKDTLYSALWSPDGTQIATVSRSGAVYVWDAVTARERGALRGSTALGLGMAWSPDGRSIATASEDKTVRVWDVATSQSRLTLAGHTDWVRSAAWSPDGHRLVTASYDGTARIWDVQGSSATGSPPIILRGHTDHVWSATWSPDGRHIATASKDKTARIWEASTGQEMQRLVGHTDEVFEAVWSPDGGSIVTASQDGTARLWDAVTGQERAILRGSAAALLSARWSPNGRTIVTASADGSARQYAIDMDNLLALVESRTTRGLTAEERAAYLGAPPPPPMLSPSRTPPH